MPASESFFARQARRLMCRPKPAKSRLETMRLEDRVVPTVSGIVYQDFNANGAFDTASTIPNNGGTNINAPPPPGTVQSAIDAGAAGVTVRLFNAAGGLVDTLTTKADGSWKSNLTVAGQQYRVEFSNYPADFFNGPHGANNGTSTQFVTDGAAAANLGIVRASDYYRANPLLLSQLYVFGGQNTSNPVLVSFPYSGGSASTAASSSDANRPLLHDLSIPASAIGTTWGLGFNRQQASIYASAFTKRHSNWAPTGGPGFIYRMDVPTLESPLTPTVTTATPWINLDGLTATLNGTAATITIDTVPAAFDAWAANRIGQTSQAYWELDGGDTGWDAVGKSSLGGLDVSDDGQFVYVMNLGDRRLYVIPVLASGAADTANIRAFDIPAVAGVANQNDIRPFAVQYKNGLVFIGLVNSAESTVSAGTPMGDPSQVRGYVYSFDPATGTYSANSVVTDGTGNGFSLQYERGNSYGGQDEFLPWNPAFQTQQTGTGTAASPLPVKWPQAMLSGITFDGNGNIVLSLRDRLGDQTGNDIPNRVGDANFYEGISVGETLMAFTNVIGSTTSGWQLERNGSSPVAANPATGFSGIINAFGADVAYGPNDGQGPRQDPTQPAGAKNPGGEFFGADFFGAGTHTETSVGAATHIPGFPDVVSTHFDPIIAGQFRTGGTRWFNSTNGNFVKGYQLYTQDQGGRGSLGATFGKSNGLGDLIAVADVPPVEIGNRIFRDNDRDGVQDANETGIGGVTVELWLPGGVAPLASVVTAADGSYYFNSGADPNTLVNPANEAYNLAQLKSGKAYEVRIPNAAGAGQQAPLSGLLATTFNVQTAAYGGDAEQNLRNSDLKVTGSTGVIGVTAVGFGESNHTFDGGMAPGVNLGNFVWEDVDNNGLFDAGTEAGLPSIPVSLFLDSNGDGIPDTPGAPLFTTTTDANGLYLFTGLLPDKYVIEITGPAGFRSSTGNAYDPLVGPFESVLAATNGNSNTDNQDHGYAVGGDLLGGFTVRSTTVTSDNPGGANPDDGGNANLRHDFGLYRAYSIGNRIWNDANNDGLYQNTEPGLDGVGVSLFGTDAFDTFTGDLIPGSIALVSISVTSNGGFYRFDNLPAGKYVAVVFGKNGPLAKLASSTGGTSKTVTFEPPLATQPPASGADNRDEGSTGLLNVVRTGVITLGPGAVEPINETNLIAGPNPQGTVDNQADMTDDFGFYVPLSLGDQVWNDKNNNGLLDAGEAGLDGVSVSLFRAVGGSVSGPALETQTTKGGGYYLFTGLGSDSYIAQINPATLPAGFVSSTGKNGGVTGPFEPGANPNTDQRDGIDRGTAGGGVVQSAAVTLSPGTAPAGVPATPGFIDTANPLDSNRTIDFGFFQPLSLGSLVWNDADNDGLFNGITETGIDGVTVSLYQDGDGDGKFDPTFDPPVGTTVTAAGGQYLFQNLGAGGYFVEISAVGFVSSTGTPGSASGPFEPGITAFTDNADHGTNAGATIRSGLVNLSPGANPVSPPIFGDPTVDGNRNYTIDFGVFQTLQVGNFVWNDANNNGVFDSGTEKGLGSVAIELLLGGVSILNTTTDANGGYIFSNLSKGDYSVRITTPAGFISSTGASGKATGPFEPAPLSNADNVDHGSKNGAFVETAVFTLFPAGDPGNPDGAGTANLRQDFGLFQPLSLGNFVWNDLNNNGVFDAATEKGLANVPVTLLDATGTVTLASTTTDPAGNYLFSNLGTGDYIVSIAPGGGFISSSGVNGQLAGPYEPGKSGTQDNEDHGTRFDATNIRAAVTLTAAGNPDNGGSANFRQDFGVWQPLALGDFIWNDADNDGVYDIGTEAPMKGVSVTLLDGKGNPVGSTTTDGAGNYVFANLTEGGYTVRVTPPAGFVTSTGKNGSATGSHEPGVTGTQNDEDHGSASGAFVEATVTLTASGTNPDLLGTANFRQDFGLFQPLSLGSFVWIDSDDDGQFDAGEPPVNNVTVDLLDAGGGVVATTKTNAAGSYGFGNLIPGTYSVRITPPAGVMPSSSNVDPLVSVDNQNVGTAGPGGTIVSPQVNLTLGGGPIVGTNTDANAYVTFDFGLLGAGASLSGHTYFDGNNDGKFTPGVNGDRPFGGITVTLTGTDLGGEALPALTTTTDKNGYYEFLFLPPGDYTITETQPGGHYFDGLDTPGSLAGANPTNDVLTVTLGANQNGTDYDFGELEPAFINGYVWVDRNRNVQKDNNEPGLPNVPVTISGTAFAGTPNAHPLTAADLPPGFALTVLTDATGYYAFPVLPPGTYTVSRGDLPVEARNLYANWGLQNGDPNPNPPTAGDQQWQSIIAGVPVRGPFNFGVIPIDPNDPSKRSFLGSSSNTSNQPNPNLPPPGGPTRGPAALNPAFTTTTGVPTGNALVVIGTGVGQRALVRVLDYATGGEKFRFEPYGAYTGGVRVAQGDIDGDGVQDIITSTGQGGGPRIRAFSGATGLVLKDFFAYEPEFRGGVFVAAGDVDGDGKAEIITGTELGGGPRVRMFNGVTNAVMQDFFAFDSSQRGGVRVAAADFDGDKLADIVVTTGASVPTNVRIFNGQVPGLNGNTLFGQAAVGVLQEYSAYGSTFTGGANLGVGDVNGDGQADVIIGTEAGGGPRVQVFDGKTNAVFMDFFAFDSKLRSGVRVGARDLNGDGKAEIVVTAGNTGAARLRILNAADLTAFEDFFAFDPEFRGGAYVG